MATASHRVLSDGAAISKPAPLFDPGRTFALRPMTRVGAAPALAYGGRSQRLCFEARSRSSCTPCVRFAAPVSRRPRNRLRVVALSRAAVETLQGSFERFQFFIRSPLTGLAWRTCRSFNVLNVNVDATLDAVIDEPSRAQWHDTVGCNGIAAALKETARQRQGSTWRSCSGVRSKSTSTPLSERHWF